MRRRLLGWVVALAAVSVLGCQGAGPGLVPPQAPFIATPDPVGRAMLELAGTTSADVVYDLGSGDGRLAIAAAREFGARGVGIEIDAPLVQQSRESALRAGVADRVRFLWQDIFASDIHEATVVTLYLGEAVNVKLRPKLLAELRPGSRIVSHNFGMAEWTPDRSQDVRGVDGVRRIHLWIVPAVVGGRWRTTPGGREVLLRMTQAYQAVEGDLVVDGAATPVRGRVTGDRLELSGSGWSLGARVSGDRAAGTVTAPGAAPAEWIAQRDAR